MNGKAPSKEVVAGKRSEFETEFASSEECDEKPKTASTTPVRTSDMKKNKTNGATFATHNAAAAVATATATRH
ncbi:hypothetical protein V9T40_007523 [Parthenolecanium corni]|uniref:Uncharacterized protein n=1 Tax=Parthenolecanium corni TaxID=536013 RepID=A0AAN9TLT5_9HEMI